MRAEDASKIILRPYVTEKTFELIERENKLVFVVDTKSSKRAVKEAVEALYDVEVESVNTLRSLIGKKAYVRLGGDSSASDLASKLGLV